MHRGDSLGGKRETQTDKDNGRGKRKSIAEVRHWTMTERMMGRGKKGWRKMEGSEQEIYQKDR